MQKPLSILVSTLLLTGALMPFARVQPTLASGQPASGLSAKRVVRAGQFVTVDGSHPTRGAAQIVEKDGQRLLKLNAAFSTGPGPAVQVVLHKRGSVPASLREADYVYIADLTSSQGEQTYVLPAGLDLSQYESVAIWCERFNITFGYAAL